MKEQIKNLRVKIDGLSQLTKELKPIMNIHVRDNKKTNTKEIEKAYDSLILAKAWLGKVLGELGEETPYKNDGNRKRVEDIEPTADKVKEYKNNPTVCNKCPYCRDVTCGSVDCVAERWDIKSHIEKVDWLREEIKKLVVAVDSLSLSTENHLTFHKIMRFVTNSSNHLSEAVFFLGFELQRIKETE